MEPILASLQETQVIAMVTILVLLFLWGSLYPFYTYFSGSFKDRGKHALFHSPDEITALLKESGFEVPEYWQTLITASGTDVEEPQPGYGEGGFVVIKAILQ